MGLINNSPAPTLLAGDTLASHSGWVESAAYSGNRKEWDDENAVAGVKGSTSSSTFNINATVTIYGIFICEVDTGTSGLLWSEGAFSAPVGLVSGDDLKASYSIGF